MPAPAAVFNKLYDPMLLYGSCVVEANSGGAPNSVALTNPHGLPMEILEIRWRIYPMVEQTNQFLSLTGSGIAMKLDMGDLPIVDADVPLTSFGSLRDTADRLSPDRVYVRPEDNETDVAVAFTYRWRLRYPLFVPAGAVATPGYTHLGQTHLPVTVQTLYVCRSLPMDYVAPQELMVPWVSSYNSASFDNLANQPAGRDFSSELDIVNPFRQPLELARLVGSCSGVFSNDTTPYNYEVNNQFRYRLGKVRIRARSGAEVAKLSTPFNTLFPFGWRAWDIAPGWFLSPGEFWKVQLNVAATDPLLNPATGTAGSIQYSMAAAGYRKLKTDVYLAAAQGDA